MPWKSKAQMRKFFVLNREGKISDDQLNEWKSSTKNPKSLPERVKTAFAIGFEKISENLPDQALLESGMPMQDYAQGTTARANMTTAQSKGRATRTFNVRNENKEFGPQFKVKYDTSRSKAR